MTNPEQPVAVTHVGQALVHRLRSERFDGGISQWIATMREAADRIVALEASNAAYRCELSAIRTSPSSPQNEDEA